MMMMKTTLTWGGLLPRPLMVGVGGGGDGDGWYGSSFYWLFFFLATYEVFLVLLQFNLLVWIPWSEIKTLCVISLLLFYLL
jgi:hypothetical protein